MKVGVITYTKGAKVHAKREQMRTTYCGRRIPVLMDLEFTEASGGEDFEVDCDVCWYILMYTPRGLPNVGR